MAIATVHGAAVLMAILLTVCSFLCWGLGRSSKLGDGKLHFQITGLCSAVCAVLLVVAAAVNSGDPSSAESGTELGKYESTPSTIYMPVFGKDGFVVEEKRLLPQEAE